MFLDTSLYCLQHGRFWLAIFRADDACSILYFCCKMDLISFVLTNNK